VSLARTLGKSPGFLTGASMFALTLLFGLGLPVAMVIDPYRRVGLPYLPPAPGHWLGTDHLGVDMLSLLVAGLRSSLYVGLLAGSVATIVGTVIGVYGGYKGGFWDDLLTAMTNLFLVIPNLIVLILLSNSLEKGRSLTLISLIIGCTTWTWTARAVRAQAASLRSRDHVSLARLNGHGTLHIVALSILPYLASYLFMVFIQQTASAILAEAALSMLGLGPYSSISLGNILNQAMQNEALTDGAWWAFLPAMTLIMAIAFALYLVNTSMEGVWNPRLRR
jgi:peptide/nickel transport system permease protein